MHAIIEAKVQMQELWFFSEKLIQTNQRMLCSEWVPSEWEFKQMIKASQ